MGEHLPGVDHQEAQDVPLLVRHPHLGASHLHETAGEIDVKVAALENRIGSLGLNPVAQRRADARDEFAHAEGLRHVVVGPEVERLQPCPARRPGWRAR